MAKRAASDETPLYTSFVREFNVFTSDITSVSGQAGTFTAKGITFYYFGLKDDKLLRHFFRNLWVKDDYVVGKADAKPAMFLPLWKKRPDHTEYCGFGVWQDIASTPLNHLNIKVGMRIFL